MNIHIYISICIHYVPQHLPLKDMQSAIRKFTLAEPRSNSKGQQLDGRLDERPARTIPKYCPEDHPHLHVVSGHPTYIYIYMYIYICINININTNINININTNT